MSGGIASEAFREFPYAQLIVDASGSVVESNRMAAEFMASVSDSTGEQTRTCCSLLGCGAGPLEGGCLTQMARGAATALPEVRLDVYSGGDTRAVWATAAPLREDGSLVALQLRPGRARDRRRRTDPHWTGGPQLRIRTLGHTRVLSRESPIDGAWLDTRAGHVLKYLLVERQRVVHADEIAENVWRGSNLRVASSVRYYVHELRNRLEPDRPKRAESSFVVFRHGGYSFDPDRVRIDADEFELTVASGLDAFKRSDHGHAAEQLRHALSIYEGDFLQDEPYAEWALTERDRLRSLASQALRALATISSETGEPHTAISSLTRLADFEPFDSEVQRELLGALLRHGRRTEAVRRYDVFRRRIVREFDEEPEFALSDVIPARSTPK